jgi:hypothetical protein
MLAMSERPKDKEITDLKTWREAGEQISRAISGGRSAHGHVVNNAQPRPENDSERVSRRPAER